MTTQQVVVSIIVVLIVFGVAGYWLQRLDDWRHKRWTERLIERLGREAQDAQPK